MAELITSPAGDRYVAVIDVSGWQLAYAGNGKLRPGAKAPDLRKSVDLGVAGVIARVGNGRTFDQSFPMFAAAAEEAGLPLGAYYYAQPNSLDAVDAADLVMQWLDGAATELPVMLDLEEYHGNTLGRVELGAWVARWLARIEELDGRRPLLYAGAAFANENTLAGDFSTFDTMQPRYPRHGTRPPVELDEWVAWLPWNREPRYSKPLGAWDGWQFSSDGAGPAYGMPSDAATDRLDLNIVREAVWQRWQTSTEPPEWSAPMTALRLNTSTEPRLVDTRKGAGKTVRKVTVDVGDPAATAAIVNLVVLGSDAHGFGTAWATGTPKPSPASCINYAPNATVANAILVATTAGKFDLELLAPAHVVVDLVGVITP